MAIFQDISLEWKSKKYAIPADRVMMAICLVEDIIAFPELVAGLQSGRPTMSKLARAYATLLRFAGVRVDDEEVYSGLFEKGTLQDNIIAAANTLMVLMTPPAALENIVGDDEIKEPEGNPVAARQTGRLSRRSSKQR